MMFSGVDYRNIYFIDIETVGCHASYDSMSEEMQKLWQKKAASLKNYEDADANQLFQEKGAIYSEFGKIICISLGKIFINNGIVSFSVKSFANTEEKKLLHEFLEFFSAIENKCIIFCGHNIKEFDLPYICRRMLVNGFTLPSYLNFSGKKPWEVQTIDTMEMWSFGDKKSYTSLNLLTTIFNIPSSKQDIDGSQVHNVYYFERNLEKISKYCSQDVVATAQLLMKLSGNNLISSENVKILS